ncbi:MAG: HAMP domain-containing histidine kinase, partial [Thermoproteota archaeon]|nr:HAMP domain-containing histidine kinase [Thermoproteota archaeon]
MVCKKDPIMIFDDSTTTVKSTKIIKGRKKALQEAFRRSLTSINDYYCVTGDELSKSYKPFLPLLNDRINKRHGSTRILTNIEKETITAVKDLVNAGAQIKHVDGLSLRRCVIYDEEYVYFSAVEPMITHSAEESVEQTEGEDLWIASTEPSVIRSSKKRFLFDWQNAISFTERIRFLEQGIEPEFLKVIANPEEAVSVLVDLAKSMRKEVLFLLPNDKYLIEVDKLKVIDYLIKSSKYNSAVIKIICPLTKENSHIQRKISARTLANNIKILNGNMSSVSMLIVDNEKFLRTEVKEPKDCEFLQSIGFSIYSNSKLSVDSYRSIFELLWNERLLNEELKRTEIMQREFINTAAHEFRNPLQIILAASRIILRDSNELEWTNQSKEVVTIIDRNARRLKRLTEDILDIAKIETEKLIINRSLFNLKDIVSNAVNDFKSHIKNEGKGDKLNIDLRQEPSESLIVHGDIGRISQVIYNLLSNAIKFTDEGYIEVIIKKENFHSKDINFGADASFDFWIATVYVKD